MLLVGTTLLFLGGGLSFMGSMSSFMGGGLVCGWWIRLRAVQVICGWGADVCGGGLMFMEVIASWAMVVVPAWGGHLFVMLSSCCDVCVVAVVVRACRGGCGRSITAVGGDGHWRGR